MDEDTSHPFLDQEPDRYGDRLILLWGENGEPHIYTHDTMPLVRSYGVAGGRTYRQQVESLFQTQANHSAFWMSYFREYLLGTDGPVIAVIVGTEAYTVHVGTHHRGYRGYDGQHFKFRILSSNRIVESNNVWSRGTVPPYFRDFLKPNAELIPIGGFAQPGR